MIRAVVLLLAAFAFFIPEPVHACAGCSNPNLAAGRSNTSVLGPGQVSAMLNLTGTTMNVVHPDHCPDIGPICQVRDEPPQLHDQHFYIGELRPIVEVGLSEVFGVEMQIPVRLTRTTIQFRRLDGTLFTPDYENIHHRNETLFGISDPWLSGRAAWAPGPWIFILKAGLSIPLGRTEENPFALGRAGLPHQHIQFGTGTVNPLLSLDVLSALGAVRLGAYAQTQLVLYENGHGYQAGNRYLGGVSGEMEVVRNLRFSVGADILNEQPERWDGDIQQDGNVGRTDLLLGATASYAFGQVTAALSLKVPVWQHFIRGSGAHANEPGQLTYPAILNLSVQRTFEMLRDK